MQWPILVYFINLYIIVYILIITIESINPWIWVTRMYHHGKKKRPRNGSWEHLVMEKKIAERQVLGTSPLGELLLNSRWHYECTTHLEADWLSRPSGRGSFTSSWRFSTSPLRWSIIICEPCLGRAISREDTISRCRNLFQSVIISSAGVLQKTEWYEHIQKNSYLLLLLLHSM